MTLWPTIRTALACRLLRSRLEIKEAEVAQTSDDLMAQLVAQLRQSPGVAETMPSEESRLVRDALDGKTVYEIAQDHSISEGAVWEILRNAARSAAATPIAQVETGGFGS